MHAGVNYGPLIINLLSMSYSQSVNFPDIFGVQFYDFACQLFSAFPIRFYSSGFENIVVPDCPYRKLIFIRLNTLSTILSRALNSAPLNLDTLAANSLESIRW